MTYSEYSQGIINGRVYCALIEMEDENGVIPKVLTPNTKLLDKTLGDFKGVLTTFKENRVIEMTEDTENGQAVYQIRILRPLSVRLIALGQGH